jgi:uncharacterized repeat protein (TIGR03803 family)
VRAASPFDKPAGIQEVLVLTFQQFFFVPCRCFAIFVSMLLCSAAAFATGPNESGPREYVIHSFPNSTSAGTDPSGNLVADSAGNLYGTTFRGGAADVGTVFELLRPVPPGTKWIESVLYSFAGGSDGSQPDAGVVFDGAGNLYGTTSVGGASGFGTVFELAPPAAPGDPWTESVLHSFHGGTRDGAAPFAGVVFDRSGRLYGATSQGGITNDSVCSSGCGTVFELAAPATPGAAWKETVIHYFNSRQGGFPRGTPIFDEMGRLYGTTPKGGLHGAGVIFRLAPPTSSSGTWFYKVLYTFAGRYTTPDSAECYSGLTLHNGVLYGTASAGGKRNYGTVFRLMPPSVVGGAWTENILINFDGTRGGFPSAGVIFDRAGNLYSTTYTGGGTGTCPFEGCGTVFRLTPPATEGSEWTEMVLHRFPDADEKDGSQPSSGVVFGKNDVLFGVTQGGGAGSMGAVFGLIP